MPVRLRSILRTVSGNRSDAAGGGIAGTKVVLNSSTVSGNTAVTVGGGIHSLLRHYKGTVEIFHSTITRNSSVGGDGGGLWTDRCPVTVFASIVAGNTAAGGSTDLRPGSETLTVEHSLIGDNADTSLAESHNLDAKGNLIGSSAGSGAIDPRLAPLADNGGPTMTHALLPASPAIDAVVLPAAPGPAHDYPIEGSLADALGGPALVAQAGTIGSLRYSFQKNQGLNLSSALADTGNYSVELLFRINTVSGGWQKILDFKNLTSNVGVYRDDSQVLFANRAAASIKFEGGVDYRLVLTRHAETDVVRAFIDGTEIWDFVDAAGEAVFDGPDQIIRFFQDDHTTGQSEAAGGSVDHIRIYDHALNAVEVLALGDPLPIVLPPYDQRGTPFARVAEGDGTNGAWADMGAFESQSVPTFATGDYNKNGAVDAADYVIWRKMLTQNVPKGSGADGNGDGVVDEDDHRVWRENFGRTQPALGASAALNSAELQRDPNPVSAEAGVSLALPSTLIGAGVQSDVSRNNRSRQAWRPPAAVAALRDNALLAWAAAQSADRGHLDSPHAGLDRRDSSPMPLADVLDELTNRDLSFEPPDAFDRAIDALDS
jgi:hypothetical protein